MPCPPPPSLSCTQSAGEPELRAKLIEALGSYTGLYRKGCVPPDATGWDNASNNKAFLEQRVVMTMNGTLSVPAALRTARPEDYTKNAVTLAWPSGAHDEPLAIRSQSSQITVIKAGGHVAAAMEFVRFLIGEGWLAHWLDFVGDRYLPPMPVLLEQPFWLDTGYASGEGRGGGDLTAVMGEYLFGMLPEHHSRSAGM
jgi:multiple sugar transport system substrate-binding protein